MEIFRRVEKKYFLTIEQYELLLNKTLKYLESDIHGFSTISNIYFDNDNNDLVIRSNEKPIYKEKIRLRGYGDIGLDSKVFLEIKKKYKSIVGKRRIIITLQEFYDYYNNHNLPINNQVMKEIDYCFKKYNLKPKLFLAYDRIAYYSKEDKNLRITFDFNIRSRNNNLYLEIKDKNDLLFNYEYYIMEIKTLGTMPIWLVQTLSELKIYPTSFSKYGTIYRKEVKNV